MLSYLQYPFMSSETVAIQTVDRCGSVRSNPVFNWMLYGKIGESPVVTPAYRNVTTTPSGKNRVLTDVTTLAITPMTQTLTLNASANTTITLNGLATASSANTAVATAAVSNQTATITAVAAGNTVVTLEDNFGSTMATVNVTVS